jgi:hypothetical protein
MSAAQMAASRTVEGGEAKTLTGGGAGHAGPGAAGERGLVARPAANDQAE